MLKCYTAGWDRNHPRTNTENVIPTTFVAVSNAYVSGEFGGSNKSWCFPSYLDARGQKPQGSKLLKIGFKITAGMSCFGPWNTYICTFVVPEDHQNT